MLVRLFLMGFSAGLIGTMVLLSWKQKLPLVGATPTSIPSSSKPKLKKIKGDCKMVFVVRKGLKATKREIATHCVHAAIEAYRIGLIKHPKVIERWIRRGSTKVALKVNSEAELMDIQKEADNHDIVNFLVRDTEQSHKSALLLAVGPDGEKEVNSITGHLKLY